MLFLFPEMTIAFEPVPLLELSLGSSSAEALLCFMGERPSFQHILPFLDGVELAAAEAASHAAKGLVLRRQLWEALCQAYISEVLQNQDGKIVPWPERQTDSDGKQYFREVFDIADMVRNGEANQCETCGTWYSSASGLDCEGCDGHWCDDCAERGPSRLPCPECPDFSKTHCWQCFAKGKIERCECADTDSWHSCCGRHTFRCERCDVRLCRGCRSWHDCKGGSGSEDDE